MHAATIRWESTSLVDDVYVYQEAGMSEEQLERRYEAEIEQYSRVKGSKNPADWAALLRAFPNGRLSEIAQSRLNALLAASRSKDPARQLAIKPARVELGRGKPVPAYFS